MSEEIQAITIGCITAVFLALILWGCDASRQAETTKRMALTNSLELKP